MKPSKKSDKELFSLIEQKIADKKYIFLPHVRQRMLERNITAIDVLYLLQGYSKRIRNKKKDSYEHDREDWKYCIEGKPRDTNIRVIITFTLDMMPIITAINLEEAS
ncbi:MULTISPECIES: DUF4258 domain-containing protein [Francisella]|uniref:DUF4258 domain-containing protein n=1 Tax=Francisella TaxID=262 RepID=UPI0008FD92ED|nr:MULTISPECIES: DUF4258 domain-containing protein [Francisella]APC96152.1 hypothetical protein KX02_1877 [Francisella tularensis subsp. novicida]MBK2270206.1 DUF4258 domain-containing protein [Francisella philomiragia]MBK2275870.1 DUF4258 domain-containing protein [Francisella philomiragia]MBK2305083.1 DUF4258 domain-containing protein [Francisella philomiragia]MBK2347054.1 DUF4258 domain-containing protein [Francisella tularensis subsp. novicida]